MPRKGMLQVGGGGLLSNRLVGRTCKLNVSHNSVFCFGQVFKHLLYFLSVFTNNQTMSDTRKIGRISLFDVIPSRRLNIFNCY